MAKQVTFLHNIHLTLPFKPFLNVDAKNKYEHCYITGQKKSSSCGVRPGLSLLSFLITCVCSFPAAAELPVVLKNNFGGIERFEGANLPGMPISNRFGGQTLVIQQIDDRAILDWDTFNVSEKNEVLFKQPRTSSIALNRVLGNVNAASIINGRITANGRVFIINHDGIIFGENAIVDTRSFVASTLNIKDDVFLDIGFEKAIRRENVDNDADPRLPAFSISTDADGVAFARPMGEILVEKGASIKSAVNGRVMMFAPTITNKGNIESEQGQIILAATDDEVYLTPAGEDSDIRGLLVAVKTGGEVNNIGALIAERGNISLLGLAVNQQGLARATTSVALNGSIILQAQDINRQPDELVIVGDDANGYSFSNERGGKLVLGANSVTEVVPDESGATATDAQNQKASVIQISAEKITFESGSITTATGGDIVIQAASNPRLESEFNSLADPDQVNAEVVIESGATIDVSGDDTTVVSVSRNFVEIEARGTELADSPLQKDGAIRGKALVVDIREGSDFLNIDGAIASIERDVHERLSPGGSITIDSAGRLSVEQGALLDISSGRVTYTGDHVTPSRLVTADGEIHDISKADKNLVYAGVLGDFEVNHEKWGVTEVYKTALGYFEPGYIQGYDAGKLSLNAIGIDFNGDLKADAIAGLHQRLAPETLGDNRFNSLTRSYDQVPLGGELVIKHLNRQLGDLIIGEDDTVAIENNYPVTGANALVLKPELLSSSGLSRIDIDHAGRIIINRPLELQPFTSIGLRGTQVLVESDIRSAGGDVSLAASLTIAGKNIGTELAGDFPAFADASTSLVKVDSTIDLSGRWSNDSAAVNADVSSLPIITQGGHLLIESDLDLIVTAGSLLDVSGGAHLAQDGKLTGGKGGDIRLSAASSKEALRTVALSNLDIQGELRAFGLQQGGSLTLDAEAIRIHDDAPLIASTGSNFRLQGNQQFALELDKTGKRKVLAINAQTLQLGGFQSYALNAVGSSLGKDDPGLSVDPGTRIELRPATLVVDSAGVLSQLNGAVGTSNAFSNNGHPLELIASGANVSAFTHAEVLPEYERGAVDLSLSTAVSGPLTIGTDAVISAGTGAVIELKSKSDIFIDGTISAPAGVINLLIAGAAGSLESVDKRIVLQHGARLLAPGVVRINPVEALGFRTGEILDAGTISIQANYGSVFGQTGAVINVDGRSAQLDIGQDSSLLNTLVGGNAGNISFAAAESFIYSGDLSAQAVSGKQGGQLNITLDPNKRGAPSPQEFNDIFYRGEFVAVFDDASPSIPSVNDTLNMDLRGKAYIPVNQIQQGGFDSLAVTVRASGNAQPDTVDSISVVEFKSDLQLSLDRRINLDAAVLRAETDVDVNLQAPYIALGSSAYDYPLDGSVFAATATGNEQFTLNSGADPATIRLTPNSGDAHLDVSAEIIELIGEIMLDGFGRAGERLQDDGSLSGQAGVEFTANKDFRLRGIRRNDINNISYDGLFRSAGDVVINAERIYPATLTDYELTVEGVNGSIEFVSLADGIPDTPLSIGGSLTVNADNIYQSANLFAPVGKIELNAVESLRLSATSLTSSSGFGVEAPFFTTQSGTDLVLTGSPSDKVRLNIAGDIVFAETDTSVGYDRELPQQFVLLKGASVDIQPGAQFDLRGGTDARATEFVPGPGGSRDILLADLDTGAGTDANKAFAILPGIGEFAPYDPVLSPLAQSVQGISVGDTVILEEGIDGLPAGEYAILPARYALFGGFLVKPVVGTRDFSVGQNVFNPDGTKVVAGYYGVAGNKVETSRRQGFEIADADQLGSRAEYLQTGIADLYSEGVLRSPNDAGTLTIEAKDNLQLAGQLVQGGNEDGRGSQVNIVADALSITENKNAPGVALLVSQLEQLGANSLLIGGRRTQSAEGLLIESVASEISIDAGITLDVAELILVADSIDVRSDASQATALVSSGESAGERENLIINGDPARGVNGDAAVLVVSNRTLTLQRSAPTGANTGQLTVSENASLQANGSVVADVAGDILFNGSIKAGQGALVNLGATRVSLGETDGRDIASGLVLSNSTLTGLDGSRLRLRSDNTVDIYGQLFNTDSGAAILFSELDIDSRGIVGMANAGSGVQLAADKFSLSNSTGTALPDVGLSLNGSKLNIETNQLTLADGTFSIQGYQSVNVKASDSVLLAGNGQLLAEAPLFIDTPVITSVSGADYTIGAKGSKLTITGANAAALLPTQSGLSGALTLQGAMVDFSGRVVLPSGTFNILQQGDVALPVAGNNIEIRAEGIIDVAGVLQAFGPATVITGGGNINLQAQTGNINIAAGSLLDISAGRDVSDKEGGIEGGIEGEAGGIQIQSVNGQTKIASSATFAAKGTGGRFKLDAKTLEVETAGTLAYSELSQLILADQFSDQRSIRLRHQGIVHDESLTVRTHTLNLASDTESIEIRGSIDASGQGFDTVRENGGSITIAAGDMLDIAATAKLFATGSRNKNGIVSTKGGLVELTALDADGDDSTPASGADNDRVNLKAGAIIDVSGGTKPKYTEDDFLIAAQQETGGSVLVHTRLLGDVALGEAVLGDLDASIIGAAKSDLIVTNKMLVADGIIDAADIEGYRTDALTFMNNAVAGITEVELNGFRVAPGLLLESNGDLTLQDEWDFYGSAETGGWHFGETFVGQTRVDDGVTGYLTLRATGNLNLLASLTDAYFVEQGFPLNGKPDLADRLSTSGESWRYTLIAGADLNSADTQAVNTGIGDIVIGVSDLEMQAVLDAKAAENSAKNIFFATEDPTFDAASAIPFNFAGKDIDLEPADLLSTGLVTDASFTVNVRTGTGDIVLAAGNDISFKVSTLVASDGAEFHSNGAVYSGGYDRSISQHLIDILPAPDITSFAFSDLYTVNTWLGGGAIFPVDGGDVSVFAGGDILSSALPALPTEWQPRIGASTATVGLYSDSAGIGAAPTHWGIAFNRFAGGIGALGGGTLIVESGGDVNNVVLAVPTNGRSVGGSVYEGSSFLPAQEITEVAGGGILKVNVTGDVNNAQYYLGDGIADIRIGGDSGNAEKGSGTEVYTGFDSRFNLLAGGEINLTEIKDPGTILQSDSQGSLTGLGQNPTVHGADFYKSDFFTYSREASIDVRALSGKVSVSSSDNKFITPVFKAVSHSNNLILAADLSQYPSTKAQVEFLAANNIEIITAKVGGVDEKISFSQSDLEVKLLADIHNPIQGTANLRSDVKSELPLHVNDEQQSLIIARDGSITTSGNAFWDVSLAESVHVQAGIDIENLSITVQHNRQDDITSFIAGRDIRQPTQRGVDGAFFSPVDGFGQPIADSDAVNQYEIAGPGIVEFIAGRSIELGTSDGIETVGNIKNPFLVDGGADLILMAGLGGEIDVQGFVDNYFSAAIEVPVVIESSGAAKTSLSTEIVDYRKQLADYLKQRKVTVQNGDTVAAFLALDSAEQNPLFADIMFNELRGSGVYAGVSGSNDYSRGFAAIENLFPQNDPQGGVSLLLSQIQTLDGGGIDLLVPGGSINAGSSSSNIIAKNATDLGIFTALKGDLNVMVDQDLLVNSTRVFALQGDLTIWSSNGNIDAGKGAKTVASVPDPITRIGPTGEIIIEFPPAVEGSGLQGKNVFLFAPKGVIDAGDAGIRTIGNLTVFGEAILGAGNFDVGGVSTGVPTASAGVGAAVAGAGDATSKSAADVAATATVFSDPDIGSSTLGIMSVNLEGFGL